MLFPKQTFLNQLFERAQLFFCYSKLHLVLHLRRDGHDSLGCAPPPCVTSTQASRLTALSPFEGRGVTEVAPELSSGDEANMGGGGPGS